MCEMTCPPSSSQQGQSSTLTNGATATATSTNDDDDYDDVKIGLSTSRTRSRVMLPWPEDQRLPGQSFLSAWYQRFTYSYMNRVLSIGAKQEVKNENDGTYLTQDDLYFVPPSMESHHLVSLFA